MSNRDSYNSYYNRRRRALRESRDAAQGVVVVFADRLEKATIDTIESGVMTGDLYLLSSLDNKQKVNTEAFLDAVHDRLAGII